ncbi:unnamed protein product [Rotaria magnacalcarata]|uniref:Phosphatidylserine synthase n=1 Tax=Rotaria magnacalcarata TaxID=392030 RepID=A0A816WPK8_9BILA|nr:unnamed protein product [Rotaria magnacalcarata]CAF3893644.1 unnamed protein product [Rotaria magnacalcarata]
MPSPSNERSKANETSATTPTADDWENYGGSCRIYDWEHPEDPFHYFKWILDALICNGGGIYLSMKTCEYLKMKPYNWRGMWTIPTVRGKMMRVFWSIYAS